MKTYMLYEGLHRNDNDMVTDFKKKSSALKAFKESTYPYAVVMVYENDDYTGTVIEKLTQAVA